MQNSRDVLTPDALQMLHTIDTEGSFAAAARQMDMVPSALTYRVRQIEDALDVLLFDRSSRQAVATEAGAELLREASRLLADVDAVANRVKRVATGWEPQLTVAVDGIVSRAVMMELCEAFFALQAPTRLRLRDESVSGTLAALTTGQVDLAIGVGLDQSMAAGIQGKVLGPVHFVFAVAPHHPLAAVPEPLKDELIRQHRAVAVADSVQRGGGLTLGLLHGQDVFTVPTMHAKLDAQLRGLACGFVPECMAHGFIETGRLVVKRVERPDRVVRPGYAWRSRGKTGAGRPEGGADPGKGLQWWLQQLESPATRLALLTHHRGV